MSTALAEAPVQAAPPAPPEPFDFDLDASSELAKDLIERCSGQKLPHWSRVYTGYKTAKADLIRLINPTHGRLKIDVSPTVPTAHDGLQTLKGMMGKLGYRWYFSDQSFLNGAIENSDPIFSTCPSSGVIAGMKPSRALAAFLMWHDGACPIWGRILNYQLGIDLLDRWAKNHDGNRTPCNADLVPFIVGDLMEKSQATFRSDLVLSANLYDILTMSHHTFFTSCLNPRDGAYRAGAQQYIADGHTLIAYGYTDCRVSDDKKTLVPYKTWRQLIHVDFPNKSAAFMLPYGNKIPDAVHQVIRKAVARLIGQYHGISLHEDGYNSLVSETSHLKKAPMYMPVTAKIGGSQFASIDTPSGANCYAIQFKDGGKAPALKLAWPVPCGCGPTCNLNSYSQLTCYR